jgi:hypothetical protein
MKGFLMAAAGLLVGTAIVIGGIAFFGADKVSSASAGDTRLAASVAMHAITFNQEINDRLGKPVQMGNFTVQRDDSTFLGPRALTLNIEVSGTKGTGKATVNMARASGKDPWVLKGGNFFFTNGPPIFLHP